MKAARWFESLCERRLDRLLRIGSGRPLEFSDLQVQLRRALEEAEVPMLDSAFVPSHYQIQLNPWDLAALSPFLPAFQVELEEWCARECERRHLRHQGPIRVELVGAISVRPKGAVAVARYGTPAVAEESTVEQTRVYPAHGKSLPVRPRLLRIQDTAGYTHDTIVRTAVTRIGRDRGNDVALDVEAVSRWHAEITCDERACRITDLGSRNGTRLNGWPIQSSLLVDGDRLDVAGVEITFVDDPASLPLQSPA